MAGLQTSIQLQDRMSAVLNNITQSMSLMINTFEAAQTTANSGIDAGAWDAARQNIVQASADLAQYREQLERTASTPVPAPVQPAPKWSTVQSQPVITNSGAERFEQEYQAANQMAQQLYKTQQQISAQARNLRVTPQGMLNDVAAVGNRVQALAIRVQKLNSIPVDLRTDRTNNELESLRGKLVHIGSVQEDLNNAMSRMDISAANIAYQRLDAIISSTERDIRDNLTAQNQFNQSIRDGSGAASGLGSQIKGLAMSLGAAFSIQKIVALSDSVTQTTARLNLMNDGLQSTEELNQKIFSSAQRARAPYMETAASIAKMGMNAGNAFQSNDELIAFMEQVNKQFVIGGASAQEQSNAMIQLSQAMAAGALRGEELNSILDAAPGIARTIEQAMGWAEGSIKQYAEKGQVSAQVVKSSLLSMADETNEKFNSMPMTFGQVITSIQTTLLQTFWPIIQMIGQGATFINEHWNVIEPVLYGVAAGILGVALAWGIYTVAQWIATGAAAAFFATLLANPLTYIFLIVAAVVTQIYRWVQSVGGLRVAWLICVNAVKSGWESLKLAVMSAGMAIINNINNMIYGFDSFKAGVLNALGALKVQGLTILQNFINGAIDQINKLISLVNGIGVISIEAIGHVEFATGAALAEEAKKQQRIADLAAEKDKNAEISAAMQQKYDRQQRAFDDARMQRKADIAAAKNDAAAKAAESDYAYGGGMGDIAGNTGKTAGNTARMADSMDMAEEDLQSMRDMAEAEVINRFTTAELTVNMGGITNQVNSQMDLDGINSYLETSIFEVLETAAEGVY